MCSLLSKADTYLTAPHGLPLSAPQRRGPRLEDGARLQSLSAMIKTKSQWPRFRFRV